MWNFLIQLAISAALMVVSILLAPKPKQQNAKKQNLDPASFPRATESDPVPIIFGKVRMRAPNTLWYGDFKAIAQKSKKPGFFGKLMGAKRQITGYKYYVGLDLALCMGSGGAGGPVTLHTVYADKKIMYSGGTSGGSITIKEKDEFDANCQFYGGSISQSVNSYVASKTGGEAPAYNGVAHLVCESAYIGESPQIPPFSFELSRYSNNLGIPGGQNIIGVDMNPIEVAYSVLTDSINGMSVKTTDIDKPSFLVAASTLFTEQNGCSLVLTATSNGAEIIDEIMQQIDGVMYQDAATGKISIRLVRQDYNTASLPKFNENNIVAIQKFTRSSWVNTYNQIRVKYTRREKKYEDGTSAVQDLANITSQGRMLTLDLSYPLVYDTALANRLASREMAQRGVPLFTISFEANRDAFGMKPGDPFIFSWAEYGIISVVMRVVSIDLGKLQDNRIVIEAGQDEFAQNLAVFGDAENGNSGVDFQTDDVIDTNIFELPRILVNFNDDLKALNAIDGESYIAPFARAGSAGAQIGYYTAHSYDNFSTTEGGLPNPSDFAPSALLVTNITTSMNEITNIIPTVVIANHDWRGETLVNYSQALIRGGNGLFVCEDELMAYETITLNITGTYTLTNVHRALLDTERGDHTTATPIYFLTSPDQFIEGKFSQSTFKTRFKSITPTGAQDDDDALIISRSLDNRYIRPLAPDRIAVEITSVPVDVTGYTLNTQIRTSGQIVPVDAGLRIHWRRRNYDSATIQLFSDPDQVPEVGVTYTLKWTLNASPTTITGLTTNQYSFTLPVGISGQLEIEITAVRDGKSSYTKEYYFVEVAP
jgi:hypothetical protein